MPKVTLIIEDGSNTEKYEVEKPAGNWVIPMLAMVGRSAIEARPAEANRVAAAVRILSDYAQAVGKGPEDTGKTDGQHA